MRRIGVMAIAPLALLATSGCTNIPAFIPNTAAPPSVAPVGPKVASLVANLKCELWLAANSREPLTYYDDLPELKTHELAGAKLVAKDREFTLQNYFAEIEYVAEAEYTLDVTETGSFNPSITLTRPYNAAAGIFPATNVALAVGGQFSESADRFINIYTSVDFSRLVRSLDTDKLAKDPTVSAPNCVDGLELQGNLGLKEVLASAIMAGTMNDVALFPEGANTDADGVDDINQANAQYTAGQIGASVTFTIVESANIGPTWTLKFFKGPTGGGGGSGGGGGGGNSSNSGSGGGSSGLINGNRQVKDTLAITFIPLCIRQKYEMSGSAPPYAYAYKPDPHDPSKDEKMIVGTPGWANYLKSCKTVTLSDEAKALGAARTNNTTILQNQLLQTLQ